MLSDRSQQKLIKKSFLCKIQNMFYKKDFINDKKVLYRILKTNTFNQIKYNSYTFITYSCTT